MKPEDLGAFIAGRLKDSHLEKWDMAPKSYDFEIRHHTGSLCDDDIRSLVAEFTRNNGGESRLDGRLQGLIQLEGKEYLLCITHYSERKFIKGTLTSFTD